MLKLDVIRNQFATVRENLAKRHFNLAILDDVRELDAMNRELLTQLQALNQEKNVVSREIGELYQTNAHDLAQLKQNAMLEIKEQITKLEGEQTVVAEKLGNLLLTIPNLLDDDVEVGADERDNVELKRWNEPRHFTFTPRPHWELAEMLNLIDFKRAAKISGSRYVIYTGQGALLFRALQQFTLEHNLRGGFSEILPPAIVLEEDLYASGQLPKFREDLFALTDDHSFLSPTAEVQLVNLHRDEILNGDDLPLLYTANTPCFRSEAGSAGKDTRGVIRQHQFWKSELVAITKPEQSDFIHEKITRTAETILEELELPYRRIRLCSGDTGFSSAKTYDIEVWLPSYGTYKEISSCSNCRDFQANRAKIRYRETPESPTALVNTLNGSSLAIDRLWAAVVENYQEADGSIRVPDALIPYVGYEKIVR